MTDKKYDTIVEYMKTHDTATARQVADDTGILIKTVAAYFWKFSKKDGVFIKIERGLYKLKRTETQESTDTSQVTNS